ncbi:putative DNA-binding domain-containing protein [Sphingobium yanoikuyae]|uniref:HvfC/BufC family peptide modification chaperone n=1 Tax=Sphingobium yanoikuyae TaxID=13690 RepID=UPI0023508F46|nr:putative DNA-binding domain-containing protein [Sphingobium yanoikuyae]HEV7436625.1 putative DNA-binding domain-containing protein [Pseudorhizobium sp.]
MPLGNHASNASICRANEAGRTFFFTCLEVGFPRTRAWIGEDMFLHAAVHHIDSVPPSNWTLDAYGRDFPTTPARLHAADPEIAEIASIEVALEDLFVAADSYAVGLDGLDDVDWDRAVLTFAPSIDLLHLQTNGFVIWSALVDQKEPPAPQYLDTPDVALLWRQGEQCRIRTIDDAELQALLKLRCGMTFGALRRDAALSLGEEAGMALVGRWLGLWLSDQMVVAIIDREQAASPRLSPPVISALRP